MSDREAALEQIGSVAKHLGALLHKKVPDIFDETPGSLTDIDFTFWRETWRYMRSTQALLDYSLTQFYRAAERHRS